MKFLIDAQPPRRFAHQLRAAGLETTNPLNLPEGNRTTYQALNHFLVNATLHRRYEGF